MRVPLNIQNGHRAAFALLVAAIVAGCSDDSDTVAGPAPRAARTPDAANRPSAPLRADSRGATENLAAQAWFDISIKANGTFKPRTRIDVAVTYTARFAASQADFHLTLPEIEFAKRSGWTETYKTTLERKIPAVVESSAALAAGAVETQTTVLEIPAPGVYRVHASARAADLHPEGASSRVARVNHEYLWLFVHDDGGRVLRDFDPALIPPGFRRQPGPARRLNAPPPPSRPARDGAVGLASSSTPGECGSRELCFQVQYYDLDFESQQRLPDIPYELNLQTPSGSTLASYTGESGDSGTFKVPCPGVAGTAFLGRGQLRLSDDKLIISPQPDLVFLAGDDLCGRTIDVHVPGAEAKTWINAQSAIEKSRSLFPARTAVTVLVNPSYAIYPGWANGCWYLDDADVISILDGRDGRHGCLWERWGSFVFAHEYGHALHHQSLGGLYDLDQDCAVHHAYTPESMVCAYQEGWADYHALRTEPTYNTPGYHYNSAEDYENNRGIKHDSLVYVEFTPEPDPNGGRADGSRYHGEITAFFYDLFDPANETHDLLELDISTVMDVMASCRVSRDTVTAAPSGIDHLIWCLEARVDTTITRDSTYFRQRTHPPDDWVPPQNFHPTAQNQDSVPWSSNHIRRLWRANLYRFAADGTDLDRPPVPASVPDPIDTPDSGWPALPAVTNEPPVAHLVVTCEVLPTCLFDGSESSDDGGIESYTWYANHVVLASGTSDTLRHRFAKPGEYMITLSVEDEQGRWASVTRPDTTIKVPDYAPTASLVVKCSALHCRFDGSGSTDDVGITSYAWHVDGDSVAVDTVSTRDHTFAAQGNHSVQLTVADSAGQTNATTVIVNVSTGDSGSDIPTACGGPDCVPEADSLQAAGIATRGWTLDGGGDVARHFARGRRARQGNP